MKLTLSPSKIDTFERCQLQFKYRYLDGRIKPPAAAAAIGTATHKAIELNLRAKLETGELLPLDAVKDAARDNIENAWAGGVIDDPDAPMGKGGAVDEAVSLAGLHASEVAPTIQPTAVERGLGMEVNAGLVITSHLDVVEADGLRDTKTIAQTPSEIKGEHMAQGQLYAVVMLANDGALPRALKIDYLVKLKREKKALTLVAPVTEETAQRALERVTLTARVIHRAIETGDFLPAAANGWMCSRKWCGYFSECPFGALKRVQG
jgi:RecB family exonuclease